jgi:hypothetical protein
MMGTWKTKEINGVGGSIEVELTSGWYSTEPVRVQLRIDDLDYGNTVRLTRSQAKDLVAALLEALKGASDLAGAIITTCEKERVENVTALCTR